MLNICVTLPRDVSGASAVFALAPGAPAVTIAPMLLTRRHMLAMSVAFAAGPTYATPAPVVFAAASLKGALDRIAQDVHPMRLSYGGSGVLARQVLQGAPADVFVSANAQWMDVIDDAGLLHDDQRKDLLSNRLVLIGASGADPVSLTDWQPMGRIAMGFVNAVPAGQYGKAAFEAAAIWDSVKPHVVEVENVRAALALVARGEVPFGVVYSSDAQSQSGVKVLYEFDPNLHPKITYPLGLLSEAGRPVYEALSSPEARTVFADAGFGVP